MEKGSAKLSKEEPSTTNAPSDVAKEKRTVYVQVNFVRLGEINIIREIFDAEIMISSRWRAPTLDGKVGDVSLDGQWNPKIYIENATGDQTPKVVLSVDRTDPNETFLVEKKRFRGSYGEVMELFNFPFDVQELSIVIKSESSINDTVLVDETREMHKIHRRSFMREQEFYLYKHIQSSIPPLSVEQTTGIVKQKRPSLKLTVNVARRPQYYIYNIFLLMSIVVVVSFTSFGLSTVYLPNRVQLTYLLLLTSVTFKNIVNIHVPKIAYFTYIDIYVLTMIIVLSLIPCWHGCMSRLPRGLAEKFDNAGLVLFAIFYVIFHVSLIGHVLLKPYSRRREMDRNERDYQNKYSEQLKLKTQKTQPEPKADV